ncbi:MAG TPA: ATP-grasp domain-containing protein [Frankiaceae bacterium]|jgi:hypothetical protein|nr:ATP-grasp domain-containing protein [Frankiaceae bacterium]
MMLLVPSDPLRPRRPDEHFADEYAAARDAGLDVALVDHDALAAGADPDAAVARVPESDDAVYRGWMLRSERYASFAAALARRGVTMRTGAEAFRSSHELPGWYATLREVTAESAIANGFGRDAFDACRSALGSGPAVLRDWVKSAKHHWAEAAYVPDVADADAAWRVASRFVEIRDDAAVGGFVLRRFETYGPAEVRTWWVAGRCALATAHPDTPDGAPPPDAALDAALDVLAPLVAAHGAPFVTVDLASRDDGVWRVVELGDGQVSDRPRTNDAAAFVAAVLPSPLPEA